jgi:hypothetical protein
VKHPCGFAPFVLALSFASFAVGWGQTAPPADSSRVQADTPLTTPLSVDQAVTEALQSNTEIRAAVRRLSLTQLKTTTATSLDDPMLMVRDWQTPLRRPWDLNQAQLMFSLQQTFPGKQKRDLRGKVAGDDVDAASDD